MEKKGKDKTTTKFTIKKRLKLEDKKDPNSCPEGIVFNDKREEFLLPHFAMLIVGKPGSGKTYLLQELLNREELYSGLFDKVLILSPSFAKMNVKVPIEDTRQVYDLEWIFKAIEKINEDQYVIQQRLLQLNEVEKDNDYSAVEKQVQYIDLVLNNNIVSYERMVRTFINASG